MSDRPTILKTRLTALEEIFDGATPMMGDRDRKHTLAALNQARAWIVEENLDGAEAALGYAGNLIGDCI